MTGHHAMFANINPMLEAELVGHLSFGAFAQTHSSRRMVLNALKLLQKKCVSLVAGNNINCPIVLCLLLLVINEEDLITKVQRSQREIYFSLVMFVFKWFSSEARAT